MAVNEADSSHSQTVSPTIENSLATSLSSVDGTFDVESLWKMCERLPDAEATDPLVGRSLGGVTLLKFLAEGGMGRVYEAEQANPSRRVAVKVLRPGLFSRETLRRFVREVSMLGSLQHPWITQVYSAGTYEIAGAELPYFVMELIADAVPLTEYAKAHNLSMVDRLDLFRKVCDAVAYGHERGIVHRDLKPRNILVDNLGRPKVIDFGVACGSEPGRPVTTLTEVGQIVGTLQYMSPEQVSGQSRDVDSRADVYSLGVVLYELLAGVPPHDLSGRPFVEAVRIVHEQRPKPLRSIDRAIPKDVAAIVQKCLTKEREARFQTAGELVAAIGSLSAQRFGLCSPAFVGRECLPSFPRAAVTGASLAGVVLGVVYVMPPISWPRIMQQSGVNAAQRASVGLGQANGVRVPNVEAGADPSASLMLQPAEIRHDGKIFRFALRDVHQNGADAFLVENVGMKKWMDQFMFPRVSYWAPEANNTEGVLTYRFDFDGMAESIHLHAISNCWDFFNEPGGVGRGASAIEVSRDGKEWLSLEDNIEPRRWGASITVDETLTDDFHGTDTLWVRVRCTTESAPVENGYNVAQFARTRLGQAKAVFEVMATLKEQSPASSGQ